MSSFASIQQQQQQSGRPRVPSNSNGGPSNGEPKKKKRRKKNKNKNKATNGGPSNNNNNGNGGGANTSTSTQDARRQAQQNQRNASGNNRSNNNSSSSNASTSSSSRGGAGETKVESRTTSNTLNALSNSPFSTLNVVPELKKSMAEVFRYQNMTKVQAQSIPVSLTGVDILAKAKTGTGKTIAFLIPALHKLYTTTTVQSRQGNVSVLVISPTRELASQIEAEAKGLIRFMSHISVQCVYGGTNVKKDLSMFRQLSFPGTCLLLFTS